VSTFYAVREAFFAPSLYTLTWSGSILLTAVGFRYDGGTFPSSMDRRINPASAITFVTLALPNCKQTSTRTTTTTTELQHATLDHQIDFHVTAHRGHHLATSTDTGIELGR
jgi:hypothetical protein